MRKLKKEFAGKDRMIIIYEDHIKNKDIMVDK